jgi:hypothetical protein
LKGRIFLSSQCVSTIITHSKAVIHVSFLLLVPAAKLLFTFHHYKRTGASLYHVVSLQLYDGVTAPIALSAAKGAFFWQRNITLMPQLAQAATPVLLSFPAQREQIQSISCFLGKHAVLFPQIRSALNWISLKVVFCKVGSIS